jgi:hypothetical protein
LRPEITAVTQTRGDRAHATDLRARYEPAERETFTRVTDYPVPGKFRRLAGTAATIYETTHNGALAVLVVPHRKLKMIFKAI